MNGKSSINRIKNTFQLLEQYGKVDLYWRRVVCYFKQRNEPNRMRKRKKIAESFVVCDFAKCKKQNDGKEMKNHLDLITIMPRENAILTGAKQVAETATTTASKSIRQKKTRSLRDGTTTII